MDIIDFGRTVGRGVVFNGGGILVEVIARICPIIVEVPITVLLVFPVQGLERNLIAAEFLGTPVGIANLPDNGCALVRNIPGDVAEVRRFSRRGGKTGPMYSPTVPLLPLTPLLYMYSAYCSGSP
jgi:hypothetical protein